jgi:hypothetical protein
MVRRRLDFRSRSSSVRIGVDLSVLKRWCELPEPAASGYYAGIATRGKMTNHGLGSNTG